MNIDRDVNYVIFMFISQNLTVKSKNFERKVVSTVFNP